MRSGRCGCVECINPKWVVTEMHVSFPMADNVQGNPTVPGIPTAPKKKRAQGGEHIT